MKRRDVITGVAAALVWPKGTGPALARTSRPAPEEVLHIWYRLVLELVRHTPTHSPPVASRAFACLGLVAFETLARLPAQGLQSLTGQVNGLPGLPPVAGNPDPALALHTAMAGAVHEFFGNTGPTGQRAILAMVERLDEALSDMPGDIASHSRTAGHEVTHHIADWAEQDGGARIENMGFPLTYTPGTQPGSWVPTSLIIQQQAPLLPDWGRNRPFAMPSATTCGLPPPTIYSEEPGSYFFSEAVDVYHISKNLTGEQKEIARFWSDDPMLSPTPPGHWISIAMQIMERQGTDAPRRAEVLAVLGVALADAFIACWETKYRHNLLRPVTYIRRVIDPNWEPLLITPPFPEYPSGHSTQSGAAEIVLTRFFGDNFAFDDATHEDDGLPVRHFASFREAAEEAGISRLYGGIHFRPAVERGLEQGRCTGAYAAALRTRA